MQSNPHNLKDKYENLRKSTWSDPYCLFLCFSLVFLFLFCCWQWWWGFVCLFCCCFLFVFNFFLTALSGIVNASSTLKRGISVLREMSLFFACLRVFKIILLWKHPQGSQTFFSCNEWKKALEIVASLKYILYSCLDVPNL